MHQIKRIMIHIEYLFTIYNSKLWQRKTTPILLLTQHLLELLLQRLVMYSQCRMIFCNICCPVR